MFWERFIELCNSVEKKPNPVAAELHISSGSVSNWKKGVIPNDTTLKKIADYFGVSVEYLRGENNAIEPDECPDSDSSARDEEIQALKFAIEQKDAEIKRLNKLLDLTLQVQETLEKQIKYLKDSGIDVNKIPLD